MSNTDISKTCFFTGHRVIPADDCERIKENIRSRCIKLITDFGVTDFIAGGALGFDTVAALEILGLKRLYPQIKLHLYLPCINQSEKWRAYEKKMWDSIKLMADDYQYIVNAPYITGCMQLRNHAMVNDALYAIAYCTRTFGGTYQTVKYAKEKQRKIIYIK